MQTQPTDAELVAVVAGIVAALRHRFPKIDGSLVLVVSAIASLLVCYVADPTIVPAELALKALRISVGAVGGVSLLGYFVKKHGAMRSSPIDKSKLNGIGAELPEDDRPTPPTIPPESKPAPPVDNKK